MRPVRGRGRQAQLRLDLLTGRLASLTLHDGRVHDTQASPALSSLEPGALYLADLGSFGLERLQAISQHAAYFLSRLKVTTQVYGPHGQRWMDLARQIAQELSIAHCRDRKCLSLVRMGVKQNPIMELHGGHLWAESQPGSRTIFVMTLPSVKEAA